MYKPRLANLYILFAPTQPIRRRLSNDRTDRSANTSMIPAAVGLPLIPSTPLSVVHMGCVQYSIDISFFAMVILVFFTV